MLHVRDVMTVAPPAARAPGLRRDVIALFLEHRTTALPVVKDHGPKLVGVVTIEALWQDPEEEQVSILMDPNPATTYPAAGLEEAGRLMLLHRAPLLPVVSGGNDLAGVLRPRDVLANLPIPKAHLTGHLARRPVLIHASTPARVALEILRVTRVAALPVLGDDGRYLGTLTGLHLLERSRMAGTVTRTGAGLAREGDEWEWERPRTGKTIRVEQSRLEAPQHLVGEFLDPGVPRVAPNAPVRDAIQLLCSQERPFLVVVEQDGSVVDLLTEIDLLAALRP